MATRRKRIERSAHGLILGALTLFLLMTAIVMMTKRALSREAEAGAAHQ